MILFLVAPRGPCCARSTRRGPSCWLAVAGGFAGLTFNTKTLAATIAFPRSGSPCSSGRARGGPASSGARCSPVVTALASLWWVVVVDVIPTSMRPYVGGSRNDTELNLLIGYNGLGRVDGDGQLGAGGRVRGLGSAGGIFGGTAREASSPQRRGRIADRVAAAPRGRRDPSRSLDLPEATPPPRGSRALEHVVLALRGRVQRGEGDLPLRTTPPRWRRPSVHSSASAPSRRYARSGATRRRRSWSQRSSA